MKNNKRFMKITILLVLFAIVGIIIFSYIFLDNRSLTSGDKIKVIAAFSEPINLGSPINTGKWEDSPSISPDGKTLYFTIGQGRNVDSYFSEKINGLWSSPKKLSFNIRNFPTGAVHTQDNINLYFASVRSGGLGESDIYLYSNGKILNLGSPINTGKWEESPFISSDGKTLYFASDRYGGLGDSDIWYSKKDLNGNWQKPINLGSPINTRGTETQPFVLGNDLYFMALNRDGVGGAAIFKAKNFENPKVIISGQVGEPTLTSDGKTIYFVHIDGGNADIYFANKK